MIFFLTPLHNTPNPQIYSAVTTECLAFSQKNKDQSVIKIADDLIFWWLTNCLSFTREEQQQNLIYVSGRLRVKKPQKALLGQF